MPTVMNVQNFLDDLSPVETHGTLERHISSVEFDSRRCRPGSLFVAVRAVNNDGHTYIPAALDAGADVIVCEQMPAERPAGTTFIRVADSRDSLAQISLRFHGMPQSKLRFIGVTGTNGKTSCTYILRSILRAAGARVGLIGTTGNVILDKYEATTFTTPEQPALAALLARMVQAGVEYVIMEVSSHALALDRVSGLQFDAALFTNLSRDHLDFHSSMRDYLAAKCLLFKKLKAGAPAVINLDDDSAAELRTVAAHASVMTYGRSEAAALRIDSEQWRPDGSDFDLEYKTEKALSQLQVRIKLPGAFNVMNATGAAAVCLGLGLKADVVCRGLASAPPAPGRMHTISLPSAAIAIIDYAHTPDALANVLRACRAGMAAESRLSCVFGCGGDRDPGKRSEMGQLAAELADVVVITNDNPRSEAPERIAADILDGVPKEQKMRVSVCLDRSAAIRQALAIAEAGDVVVIAGKGHESYQIINGERRHFSDFQEVDGFIKARDKK